MHALRVLCFCTVELILAIIPTRCTNLSNSFCFGMKIYVFRTVPMSIIRGFSLYTQQWYISANLYDIYHPCINSEKTPDDVQRICPEHVESHSKNKVEKIVHLVRFIIRNLTRCTVT
jgi:hypothetical protein